MLSPIRSPIRSHLVKLVLPNQHEHTVTTHQGAAVTGQGMLDAAMSDLRKIFGSDAAGRSSLAAVGVIVRQCLQEAAHYYWIPDASYNVPAILGEVCNSAPATPLPPRVWNQVWKRVLYGAF